MMIASVHDVKYC